MGKSQPKKPLFADTFLTNAHAGLMRRKKSISRRGQLFIEKNTDDDDYEWLTIAYQCTNRFTFVLQLLEANRAHIYVRSNRAKDRGKIIFRMEDMFLPDNASVLTAIFEESINAIYNLKTAERATLDFIHSAWKRIQVQAVRSRA